MQRHRIYKHGGAISGEYNVVRCGRLADEVVAVLEARAPTSFDAYAKNRPGGFAAEDLGDPLCGAIRQPNALLIHLDLTRLAPLRNVAKNGRAYSQSRRKPVAKLPLDRFLPGGRWLAPYGVVPSDSRGRLHPETEDALRSPFQRDRDRVIHSQAFRRLKQKTQVFIHHEGDHFRTRLSHSLEVAQIARSIARPLGLDEDLAEALALAHDLGHPPFGHAGERALDEALAAYGGFDHNAQSLRVVTELERRYPRFNGLNLTFETLEGLVKHNGPVVDEKGRPTDGGRRVPVAVQSIQDQFDLELDTFATLEAQVASISDDVAYDCHDVEDGLRAGLLDVELLGTQPLTGPILAKIRTEFPALDPARTMHELVRRMISLMIHDVLGETVRRIDSAGVRSAEEARRFGAPLVGFSADFVDLERALKTFLFTHVYRHDRVMRPAKNAESIVVDLFAAYFAEPELMPDHWAQAIDPGLPTARRVADYVAGMTDRYAISEHRRLFDGTPDLG